MSEEEIRLIKGYFNDGYCCDLDELKEIANKMIDQLQQKEKIIKEVGEYIEEHIKYECDDAFNGKQFYSYHLYDFDKNELLEILDKENKQ